MLTQNLVKTGCSILLALFAVILSGCTLETVPPHRPFPLQGGNVDGRYYQRGLSQGASDARKGLSNHPGRYLGSVPRSLFSEFSSGYRVGYRNNERPSEGFRGAGGSHGGGFWRSGRSHGDPFYDQGRGWGDHDRQKGYSYMPSRYYKKVPEQSRSAFNRGYGRGYGR